MHANAKTADDACLICGKPVPSYEPGYCCDGYECCCRGEPTNPCVCSEQCYDALMAGIGKAMEQRRQDAQIPKWTTPAKPFDPLEPLRPTRYGIDDEHFERDPVRSKFDE